MMGTDAQQIAAATGAVAVAPAERDVPLGPMTWFRVGGRADRFARPIDVEHLRDLAASCRSAGLPLRVLGKGANLLVADEGVDGLVVRLDAPAFRAIEIDAANATARAAAGSDLERLILETVRAGLGGLEALGGIPASVGGALCMNAGGAFGEIGEQVHAVTVLDADGTVRRMGRDALRFAYRSSNLRGVTVLGAEFALTPGDPDRLRDRLKRVVQYKKQSQPMAARSAGCTFKNPPREVSERGAGRLIDEAGLKGLRIGGATVSPRHANFIELDETASASDVLALMTEMQQRVAARWGVELEREVVVWSRDRAA